MEPLAVSLITMGSNFELAQIWLGDGKANEVGKRCDLSTNLYLTCGCNEQVTEVNRSMKLLKCHGMIMCGVMH